MLMAERCHRACELTQRAEGGGLLKGALASSPGPTIAEVTRTPDTTGPGAAGRPPRHRGTPPPPPPLPHLGLLLDSSSKATTMSCAASALRLVTLAPRGTLDTQLLPRVRESPICTRPSPRTELLRSVERVRLESRVRSESIELPRGLLVEADGGESWPRGGCGGGMVGETLAGSLHSA